MPMNVAISLGLHHKGSNKDGFKDFGSHCSLPFFCVLSSDLLKYLMAIHGANDLSSVANYLTDSIF